MSRRFEDSPEIGGRDPLDTQFERQAATLAPPPETWLRRLARRLRTRAAFGLAPALAPTMVFVPLGYLLGPPGVNLLPARALDHLDPVISVGLATLGVFVGLALGRRPRWDARLFLAASFEAIVTIVIVSGAILYLLYTWHLPLQTATIAIALVLGVSASASSAAPESHSERSQRNEHSKGSERREPAERVEHSEHHEPAERVERSERSGHRGPAGRVERRETAHAIASRVADLDDVLPIAVGALAVAMLSEQGRGPWISLALVVLTMLIGLAVGIAGWLLIERAHSIAERGLFVLGLLALLGGASAYLTLSPLLAGLTAGVFWNWSPGRADAIIRADLRKFQHPLVVLMLLAAGASLDLSMAALWLFAPFVVFRMAGKLAGGWLASRLTPGLGLASAADLGAHLLAPGLLGIAFALNVHQHLATPDAAAVLTAVVIGTLASEGVALLVTPAEGES